MKILIYGFVTGVLFGFFLQKGRVLRYDKQIGVLRLKDMTIIKFMLSAVLTAMVGIYLLLQFGLVELDIKSANLAANILGGLLFGMGWAIVGYCPGTSVGAVGEGRWDGIWAILGMLAGAMLFAEIYPFVSGTMWTWWNVGKVTLPQLLHVNQWVVVIAFVAGGLGLFWQLEKHGL